MRRDKLSLNSHFAVNSSTVSSGTYCGTNTGLRLPFDGTPAIPYPVIGAVYAVRDYTNKGDGSSRRPMILVAYYMHEGKPVALDFISPTSKHSFRNHGFDEFRYDLFLPMHQFSSFVPKDLKINCNSILSLPNNRDIVLQSLPIDKFNDALLADYFLRRALILYEQKAIWKKDALIPEHAVRYGCFFEDIGNRDPAFKERYVPDMPHTNHKFEHFFAAPGLVTKNFEKIKDWAYKASLVLKHTGVSVDLPPLKTIASWPKPEAQLKDRNLQIAYSQALNPH